MSLTPKLSKPMKFLDALKEVMDGKRVKRLSWKSNDYCLMKDGYLSIYTVGKFHQWIVNDGDMDGDDWVVVTATN